MSARVGHADLITCVCTPIMLTNYHREASKQLNESRLKVLAARETVLADIIKEAEKQLQSVCKDKNKYSALLKDLLVQVCA